MNIETNISRLSNFVTTGRENLYHHCLGCGGRITTQGYFAKIGVCSSKCKESYEDRQAVEEQVD